MADGRHITLYCQRSPSLAQWPGSLVIVRLAQFSSEQRFIHSKAKFDIVFVRHVNIDTHQNKVNCLYK